MRTVHVCSGNTERESDERINPAVVKATGQALPSSRQLDGSDDHGFAEEWLEAAVMPDGRECYRAYLFDVEDITDDDGEPLQAEDYPWDDDHVRRIECYE